MENSPPSSTRLRPLSASGLLCLFGRPRDFFSGAFDLKHLPSLIVIALICGLERASASLALDALSPEQLNELFNGLQPSWSQIWRGILPTAFLFGVVKWFIGGFWCHIRAVWCGYTGDDRTLTRAIFLYTEFFAAAPLFAFFALQTLQYPDPMAAAAAENHTFIMLVSLGLGLLSIVLSYQAVQQRLNISGQKTKLWFLILPISLNVIPVLVLLKSSAA